MIRSLLGRKKGGGQAPDAAGPDIGEEKEPQPASPTGKRGKKGLPAKDLLVDPVTGRVARDEDGNPIVDQTYKKSEKKDEAFSFSIAKTGKNLAQGGAQKKKEETKPPPLDVLGCVVFLQGKLKELTDQILGPEKLRLMSRGNPQVLLQKLKELLHGEDETSSRIRRGLSLSDASRHRPDIGHPQPMEALKVFENPRHAVLRKFPLAQPKEILRAWQEASQEYLLASTVVEFLKFISMQSGNARETVSALAMVECMILTVGSVLNNRHEIMSKEPEMTHTNMMSIADKYWARTAAGTEQQYRQQVVKEWCEQRAEDIICTMEDNVEQLSETGHSLWGTLDYKYERLKVNTALFNFLDFVVNFLDFAYDKGYVFKPSSNPPAAWTNAEVVEWFSNLRLYDYVDKIERSGITGTALLECTRVDLECALEITDDKAREKVWRGLETLRQSAHYEAAPHLERETRGLVTLKVPQGASAGGTMLMQDPAGKNISVKIPLKTVDRTRKMKPGMEFQIKQTYKKFVLNKWQAGKNQAAGDIGGFQGCLRPGQERSAKNLWKGALSKVKLMNLLESKVSRVLRMSQSDNTVRLCAMDLNYKDAMSVHDFLLVNGVCRQLELSFNNLGPGGATAIANALRDNRTVCEVRMASCRVGDDGALEFAELLRISETLQEIDLGDNDLTDRSGVSLFAAVARSPPMRDSIGQKIDGTHVIRRVMLYKNKFSHQTMQAFAKCIKRHRTLICDMTENPVGDHGVSSICKVLTKYWDHGRLDMRSMSYGPDGLRPLTLVLANSSWRTVTSLFLSGNYLGVEGANHLSLVIETNLSLTELDVSGCGLSDAGVRYLFKALEQNERLEYMDLGDNGITDTGVTYITDLLRAKGERALTRPHLYPFSLRRVVLATNDITSTGFGVFSSAVTIAHLRTVEVSCCKITDDGLRVFAQYLVKNRTIKVIDVSSNLLTADGIWVIAEPLRANESLETLRINDNRLADSGARAIASVLKFNLSLREVNAAGNGIYSKGAGILIKVLALRLAPIEVHMHGNPCTREKTFLEMEQKLTRKNPIITIHR